MKTLISIIMLYLMMLIGGCIGGARETVFDGQKILENQYISFSPLKSWYTLFGEKPWISQSNVKAQTVYLGNERFKGTKYDIDVQTWPFEWKPYKGYFNKVAEYKLVLQDKDMHLDENDKEQGIGYVRQWVSYIQGLKCTEGVFSRSRGGMMKGIGSKNYSLTCGYYDKVEGKRLLRLSYRYNYAGGPTRHQKDADTAQSELINLEQAELGLKQALKQLVRTIKIKNLDRERMEREGLMHYDKHYEISEF